MEDDGFREPVVHQLRHPCPREPILLATPPQRAPPEVGDMVPEHIQCLSSVGLSLLEEVSPSIRKVAILWNGEDRAMVQRYQLSAASAGSFAAELFALFSQNASDAPQDREDAANEPAAGVREARYRPR